MISDYDHTIDPHRTITWQSAGWKFILSLGLDPDNIGGLVDAYGALFVTGPPSCSGAGSTTNRAD